MNNDDYERHIVQKYSVAVALAVIKNKPPSVSLADYLNELKTKVDPKYLFQDVTISESDFENSDVDLNEEFKNDTSIFPENYHIDGTNFIDTREYIDQNLNENNQIDGIHDNADDSFAISQNNTDGPVQTKDLARNSSIKEILDIFNEIDTSRRNEGIIGSSTPKIMTQSTFCEATQVNITDNLNNNNEDAFAKLEKNSHVKNEIFAKSAHTNASQETELYTIRGFTDNFTHISQSQNNIIIPNNFLHNCNNDFHKMKNDRENNNQLTNNGNSNNEQNLGTNQMYKEIYDSVEMDNFEFDASNTLNKFSNERIGKNTSKIRNSVDSSNGYSFLFKDTSYDNNRTVPKEPRDKVNNFEDFSGGFGKIDACSKNSVIRHIEENTFQGIHTSDKDIPNNQIGLDSEKSLIEVHHLNLSDSQFIFLNSNEKQTVNAEINIEKLKSADSNFERLDNAINFNDRQVQVNEDCKCKHSSGYQTMCTGNQDRVFENLNENDNSDVTDTQEEIVTFKILEELNRVKKYIYKQDKRLSDSTRSNSQGSQLSGVRINESGYSLLSYMTQYSLPHRTSDITEEISRVFGRLVDKLHEEENYPQFLDKILEKVEELMADIYEGSDDLLNKGDKMSRLLLLNRSTSIIKYTIEKVLPILDNVCVKLQKKDFLEIECLDESENLCYIFHLLEVLLRRHNSAMASSQASTQVSQDDERSLKRSTITEIWRKKWNLSKSDVSEGSFKKKCVLTQISEVLNKIIVQGMDNYSLISFAALQCFNSLQSK